MTELTELDDETLWRAFHDQALPSAAWTHAAHLRVAWMHLVHHSIDEAHILMRVGIIRLNQEAAAHRGAIMRILTKADLEPPT